MLRMPHSLSYNLIGTWSNRYLNPFLNQLLNLILPTAKVISLCHQNRASLTRLYTVGWPTLGFYLDIPKNNTGGRWIFPFMKFGMVRVKFMLMYSEVQIIRPPLVLAECGLNSKQVSLMRHIYFKKFILIL